MKIKTKLLSLIISMIGAVILSLGIYIGFDQYAKNLEKEQQIFQDYRDSILESHKELLRFTLEGFTVSEQMKVFKKSLEIKVEKFERIDNITLLPTLSEDIVKAIKSIKNLEQYQSGGIEKFYSATDNLMKTVKEIMTRNDTFILNSIYDTTMGFNEQEVSKLRFYSKKMKNELNYLEVGMQTAANILDEQTVIIDSQVRKFRTIGSRISLIFIIIVIVASILISSLTSRRIVGSISQIGMSLSVMANKDLTHNISVSSKDELGALGSEMNVFQNELNESLNTIKDHSQKNEDVKNYLINTVTETSSASVEIAANISSVDNQMNTLNNNILSSSNKVNEISSFTNDLNNHITDQMAMVEQSTAAITQMIASITSVASLTQRNRDIMGNLQVTAKDGDEQLTETTDIIEEINSSVHNIGAMAEVIQNISDQTNLLAMNAAIEAAHAGDAGKGFAVVADEIRKLSEASNQSSKDISQNLKEIVQKFEQASVSGTKTRDAFSKIYNNIQNISDSLITVSSSTSELDIGGKQILEAMDSLSTISAEVQDKSEKMKASADSVKDGFMQVSEISTVVTQAMEEVNIGFGDVNESIAGLEKISNEVGNISNELSIECNKFKTSNSIINTDIESKENESSENSKTNEIVTEASEDLSAE